MLRAACAAVRAAQRVSGARAISSTAHRLAEEGGAPAQGKEVRIGRSALPLICPRVSAVTVKISLWFWRLLLV